MPDANHGVDVFRVLQEHEIAVQEIERESEQRLLEERERKRQAVGQDERLQAVEAAARASIDTPPSTPGVAGSGKGGGGAPAALLSEQERVAAAARAAALRYDPNSTQPGPAGGVREVGGDGNDSVCTCASSC